MVGFVSLETLKGGAPLIACGLGDPWNALHTARGIKALSHLHSGSFLAVCVSLSAFHRGL